MSKWPWPERLKNSVFASPLSLFVDAGSDGVVGLGRGHDAFGAGEGDAGLEGGELRYGHRFDQLLVIELRYQRRVAVVAQAAGVDAGWHEVVAEGVHQHHWRELGGVAEIIGVVAARQGGTGFGFHRNQTHLLAGCLVGEEGEGRAAEVGAQGAKIMSG